jgi:Holliday junction resolvase RusA-like endonuclease
VTPVPNVLVLELFVPGTPRPQGSVKPMVNKGTGRAFVKYNDTTIDHRNRLIHALSSQWHGSEVAPPIDGAVMVVATFTFERPKSHWRTGRNAHLLRDSAPLDMISAPDTDKLLRLVGDALEISGVVGNDSQIRTSFGDKEWGETAGTLIRVYAREVPDLVSPSSGVSI